MLPPADRVYLACGFTDMRKGFDGLAALVQTALSLDPYGGAPFIFRVSVAATAHCGAGWRCDAVRPWTTWCCRVPLLRTLIR